MPCASGKKIREKARQIFIVREGEEISADLEVVETPLDNIGYWDTIQRKGVDHNTLTATSMSTT